MPAIRDNKGRFVKDVQLPFRLGQDAVAKLPKAVTTEKGETIHNPATINFLQRDSFMRSCEMKFLVQGAGLAKHIYDKLGNKYNMKSGSADYKAYTLAGNYMKFVDMGARLPKFGRWVNSLFPNNSELNNVIALLGQDYKDREVVVSCSLNDILRSSYSNAFVSCLKVDANGLGSFPTVLPTIAEKAAGIAIAYTENDQGHIAGRIWLHHAKLSDGEDVVVAARAFGAISVAQVREALATKGIKVFDWTYSDDPLGTDVEWQNCLTESIHWDTTTWRNKNAQGNFVGKVRLGLV